jgi:hypothetical protein
MARIAVSHGPEHGPFGTLEKTDSARPYRQKTMQKAFWCGVLSVLMGPSFSPLVTILFSFRSACSIGAALRGRVGPWKNPASSNLIQR